ncbi:MAG: hypothetical protein OEZ01_09275 [Candidatus Heimdallarchaeota archaeon]|nr:hypothetical protein [Candidatus Heimdallarchaeota archaeon]MDH5646186.1 hypothetical protein [Candidatus Heimdallarchaeota archaeon]
MAEPIIEYYLPFEIPEENVDNILRTWLGTRSLAPGDLVEASQITSIVNNYIPVYLYTAAATGVYNGTKSVSYMDTETYTEYDSVSKSTVTRTRSVTRYRTVPVAGTIYLNFENEMVYGIQHTQFMKLNAIRPYDFVNLQQLQKGLPGNFIPFAIQETEGYQLFVEQVRTILINDAIMREGGSANIFMDIPVLQVSNMVRAFIPVWEGAYKYKELEYPFVVNGRNGNIDSEYSKSAAKQALLYLLIIGGCIALLVFLGIIQI